MAEENKSLDTAQYFPTVDPGYKISVGANGQGTLFDTNGNMFHFTSPDDDLKKQLMDAKWSTSVGLTADNRTMIAAGKDLFNTPFFKLDQLGCINYETSNENITNNVLPAIQGADPEVTYSKTGDIWTFKFEEKSRGTSGFNLAIQSANNFDALHQLSNVATKIVGDDLKTLYKSGDFHRIDIRNIKLEYKSTTPVTYTITIPLKKVPLATEAYVNFEHKGSWSTTQRTLGMAQQDAYKAIYGNTPFDSPSGAPTTWNFPSTNWNATNGNGWAYLDIIKTNFPLYSFTEKTTDPNNNNVYEVFFQWNDLNSLNLVKKTQTTTPTTADDELAIEGEILDTLPSVENQNPVRVKDMAKAIEDERQLLDDPEIETTVKFNLADYTKLLKSSGGSYDALSDAIKASAAATPDGQLFLKWWANVLQWEGAGGFAEGGDSGGLTTWGCTIATWKKYAPTIFPGQYTGSDNELKSLNTEAGKAVIGAVAKAVVWDTVCKKADNTTPDIFKCIAFENMWGGQNLMGKGNIWQNAQKMNVELGGDVQAAFIVLWGWKRACGKKNLFNLAGFPGDRWGLGWSSRTGIGWFTKDPITGKDLPKAAPYRFTTDKRISTYQFYLDVLKGTAFHAGDADWSKLPGKAKKGRPNSLDILTESTLGTVTYKSNGMKNAVTYNGPNSNHW
jgi:hypothetical protein